MTTSSAPARKGLSLPSFLQKDSYMTRLILVLALLLVFFAIIRPGPFFATRTWVSMAIQFPEFGLMALGVMLTMFTAGIDLSVVAIANVTSICAALVLRAVLTGDATPGSMGLAAVIALALALAGLASRGTQVFLATHSLFLLRELQMLDEAGDADIRFIGMGRSDSGEVSVQDVDDINDLDVITALEAEIEQSARYLRG